MVYSPGIILYPCSFCPVPGTLACCNWFKIILARGFFSIFPSRKIEGRPFHFSTIGMAIHFSVVDSVSLACLQGEVKVKKTPKWHLWSNTSFLPSSRRCESKAAFIFFSFFSHFYFFCDVAIHKICVPKAIKCFLIGHWTSKRILLDSLGFAKEIFGTDCKFRTARGAIKIATTFAS